MKTDNANAHGWRKQLSTHRVTVLIAVLPIAACSPKSKYEVCQSQMARADALLDARAAIRRHDFRLHWSSVTDPGAYDYASGYFHCERGSALATSEPRLPVSIENSEPAGASSPEGMCFAAIERYKEVYNKTLVRLHPQSLTQCHQ